MFTNVTNALKALYYEMSGETAKGTSPTSVLNAIAAYMGATTKHSNATKCIEEIAANYNGFIASASDDSNSDDGDANTAL